MILVFIPILTKIGTSDIPYNVLNFFGEILYSLNLVLVKKLTHNYYLSPYLYLLYLGIFSSFFTFIGYLIYSFIKEGNLSFITKSFNFSKMNGLFVFTYIVGIVFFESLFYVLAILTIFYFSPVLLMITFIISPLFYWIFNIFINNRRKFINYN